MANTPTESELPRGAAPTRDTVVTHHVGVFNGRRISYTASVRELVIPNGLGNPAARIVSIEYVADGVDDPTNRPVVFLCNGGPIVPSVALHMGAFGPRRIAFPDDIHADPATFQTIENEFSLLDVADLVFFDPVGTGYSRVIDGVNPGEFYGVAADARQMTTWIERWLRASGRHAAPKYLLGESYGTIRVAVVAKMLTELQEPIALNGAILISQATNIIETSGRPANILSYVASLPTLTAVAWYHGKIERQGRTLDEAIAEAFTFASDEYLRALYQGNALPAVERERVARLLEALTGIRAERWIEKNLRLLKADFRVELLEDENLVLSLSDGRYAGPPDDTRSAAGSPMPRLHAMVSGHATPKNVEQVSDALNAAAMPHLRKFLNIDWPDDYRLTQPPIIPGLGQTTPPEEWAWSDSTSPFGDWPYMRALADAMGRAPEMRLFLGSGKYDLSTTIGAAEHAAAQATWPRDRVQVERYDGGHLMYSISSTLERLARHLRAFIQLGQSQSHSAQ
jgi:carboxypeptidase C (cathepsin A)